jgi:flavoprotein
LSVVRQLLAANKVDQARKAYGPIAFYPHQSKKGRVETESIMKLLVAKDTKGALAEIARQQAEDAKT